MHYYINNQSEEIRRLSERNEYLESQIESLELAWDVAFDECKREQSRNDELARKLILSLGLNCAMGLVIGWLLL